MNPNFKLPSLQHSSSSVSLVQEDLVSSERAKKVKLKYKRSSSELKYPSTEANSLKRLYSTSENEVVVQPSAENTSSTLNMLRQLKLASSFSSFNPSEVLFVLF